MARVVVVGAGMGGLAAAARLAAQGHQVTVCEQSCVHGGQVAFYERDGFGFDLGPARLSLPAVYRDLFLKTGSALEKNVELVSVDPVGRYLFPDKAEVLVANAARGRLVATFDAAFGEGAGPQWSRFIDKAGDIWDVTRRPLLENPVDGSTGLLRQALRARQSNTPRSWRSLRGLVRRYLHDDRLRRYAERFATAAGADPRTAPASLAVLPYIDHAFGVWYIRGGMRRLADALRARGEERGVRFRFDATVRSVAVAGGRVSAVELADGGTLEADLVVSDIDARRLYGELVEVPAPNVLRRAGASPGVFTLLLALRGADGPDGPSGARHAVLFGPDGDSELDGIFPGSRRLSGPVAEPTITVHAPDDPALRPDRECAAWRVCVDAPCHSDDGRAGTLDWRRPGLADAYAGTVLTALANRGLDVRDRVLWQEIRTPADAESAHAVPGGSANGPTIGGSRAVFARPANTSPVPGLFLVGGSAHPGSGLPLVGMSAAVVAQFIGPA